jgi:hypothetical protein
VPRLDEARGELVEVRKLWARHRLDSYCPELVKLTR